MGTHPPYVLVLSPPEFHNVVEKVEIEVRSACEADMGGEIYRSALGHVSVVPKATWLLECPSVVSRSCRLT